MKNNLSDNHTPIDTIFSPCLLLFRVSYIAVTCYYGFVISIVTFPESHALVKCMYVNVFFLVDKQYISIEITASATVVTLSVGIYKKS